MDIALENCNAITMARIGAKALRERTQRLVSKVFGVVPATASRSSKSDYTKIWHRAFEDLKESHATRSSSRERKLFMELAEAAIHIDEFKKDNAALRAERDSSIARCEAARKKMRRTSEARAAKQLRERRILRATVSDLRRSNARVTAELHASQVRERGTANLCGIIIACVVQAREEAREEASTFRTALAQRDAEHQCALANFAQKEEEEREHFRAQQQKSAQRIQELESSNAAAQEEIIKLRSALKVAREERASANAVHEQELAKAREESRRAKEKKSKKCWRLSTKVLAAKKRCVKERSLGRKKRVDRYKRLLEEWQRTSESTKASEETEPQRPPSPPSSEVPRGPHYLRSLTDVEEVYVGLALNGDMPEHTPQGRNPEIPLFVDDLMSLENGSKVVSPIIDAYLGLAQKRTSPSSGNTYCFMCELFTHLDRSTTPHQEFEAFLKSNHDDVPELSRLDKIIFPIEQGGHFMLIVADMRQRRLSLVDSLESYKGVQREKCLNLVRSTLLHYEDIKRLDWGIKHFEVHPMKVPQQTNGFDCGVFACIAARSIMDGLKLVHGQQHMPAYRRLMCWQLLNGSLD